MPDAYVVNVFDDYAGSELSADASAAATTITVVDLIDFNQDPDGGTLQLDDGTNSESVDYTVPADSTGTVNLGSGLVHSYLTGTKVTLLINGLPVVERWADCREPDGEEMLRALVPHDLRGLLHLGPRDEEAGASEYVQAEMEGSDYVIRNVLGTKPRLDATSLTLPQGPNTAGAPDTDSSVNWVDSEGVVRVRVIGNREAVTTGAGTFTDVDVAKVFLGDVDGVLGGASRSFLIGFDGSTILSDFVLENSGGGWADWTPTSLSGWSANPTNAVYRYIQHGKLVVASIRQATAGTSNATTKSIAAPVAAATKTNMIWAETCAATDNGSDLATSSQISISSGTQTFNFAKDLTTLTGGWTASGGHKIKYCTIIYEAA